MADVGDDGGAYSDSRQLLSDVSQIGLWCLRVSGFPKKETFEITGEGEEISLLKSRGCAMKQRACIARTFVQRKNI